MSIETYVIGQLLLRAAKTSCIEVVIRIRILTINLRFIFRLFTKSKRVGMAFSLLECLPEDLLVREIFLRVAAESVASLFNLRLACKNFWSLADDEHVYRSVSIEDKLDSPWGLTLQQQNSHREFWDKCLLYENPEANYRQSLVSIS